MSPIPLSWRTRAGVAAACAAVVALYCWIAGTTHADPVLGAEKPAEAYYNLLVDGFLRGQVSLARPAPPELAQLPDPYDPAANAPYRVYDATYYRGRLYLYFGAGPALLLFLPWRLLTGGYLWHGQAVAFFSALGFLLSAGLFLAIARRYRSGRSGGLLVAGVLVLAFASVVPVMLRRPELWEVPISCGYALVMASLLAWWRAGHEIGRRRRWWLAAASLFYGLAIAARPSLLFGAAILLLPLWREMRSAKGGRSLREEVTLAAAAILPIFAIGCGLLLYNYLRFENPFEFGQRYQLVAGKSQLHLEQFVPNPAYIGFNLRAYFYQKFCWSSYFPFVVPLDAPPIPAGTFNVEEPFGVLNKTPIVWLALAAPLAWWGLRTEARAALRSFCAGAGWLFLSGAILICLLPGCCVRYQVDFMPALALLAAIGLLGVERVLAMWPVARWPARLLVAVLLGWSMLASFSASCEYWDLFQTQRPATYHALARSMDYPAHWLERAAGRPPGPWQIRLRLPPFTAAGNETLIATGAGSRADYLFLNYVDARHLVVGAEHTSHGGPRSAPIAVDYAQEHTLVVEMGSLYPPADHPYFDDPKAYATLARTDRLRVRLDGAVVLDRLMPFYASSPGQRFLGHSPYARDLGRAFTGRILDVQRLAPPEPLRVRDPGSIALQLSFTEPILGRAEPLVVTGRTGRGDTLYVRMPDAGHAIFGLDHWGVGLTEGEAQAVDLGRPHTLRVQMGSLYPPGREPSDPAQRRQLAVWLDEREVLAGAVDGYPASAGQVYFGLNPIGSSSAASHFSGTLSALPGTP